MTLGDVITKVVLGTAYLSAPGLFIRAVRRSTPWKGTIYVKGGQKTFSGYKVYPDLLPSVNLLKFYSSVVLVGLFWRSCLELIQQFQR